MTFEALAVALVLALAEALVLALAVALVLALAVALVLALAAALVRDTGRSNGIWHWQCLRLHILKVLGSNPTVRQQPEESSTFLKT